MIDGRLFFYLSYIKAIKTRHKQITDIHVPRLKLRVHFLHAFRRHSLFPK